MAAVVSPTPDRTIVERLAHLPSARGRHDPRRTMELEASQLPLEAEERDEAPALTFEVSDHILVPDVVPAQREYARPMSRESRSFDEACRTIFEVIGERQAVAGEALKIT